MGTVARWHRARLLDGHPDGQSESCRAYADVARLWAAGDPPFRARAAWAAERVRQLACTA